MALNKNRTTKGFDADYWMISDFSWEKSRGTVSVILKNYKDRDTRVDSLENSLAPDAFVYVDVPEEAFSTFMAAIYESVKTNDTSVDTFTTETVPAELDEEGNIVVPEYTRQVRTPFFSDAESDE